MYGTGNETALCFKEAKRISQYSLISETYKLFVVRKRIKPYMFLTFQRQNEARAAGMQRVGHITR